MMRGVWFVLLVLVAKAQQPTTADTQQPETPLPQRRVPYGFSSPLTMVTDSTGAKMRSNIFSNIPRAMQAGLMTAFEPTANQHKMPLETHELTNAMKSAFVGWTSAAKSAKQGFANDLALDVRRVNESFTEIYLNTMCPTKKSIMAKFAAVGQILGKIAPLKQFADKLAEYPIISLRLLRHRLFGQSAFEDMLASPDTDHLFEKLYATPGYNRTQLEQNPQMQEFTMYHAPNGKVVTDPAHIAANMRHQSSQQGLQTAVVSPFATTSFLQTEVQTGGVMKMVFCGFFGTLLLTWIFISLGYWILFECYKYGQKGQECFRLKTAFMKYQPIYEIFVQLFYELDTQWPPRKLWLQSFVEGLPRILCKVKVILEAWAGGGASTDESGGEGAQEPEPAKDDKDGEGAVFKLCGEQIDISSIQQMLPSEENDPIGISKLTKFTEDDITDIINGMPAVVTEVLGVDDPYPWLPEDKKKKAKLWRREDEVHNAVRNGISCIQSSVGPSYSPFGLFKFVVQSAFFLMLCDLIFP